MSRQGRKGRRRRRGRPTKAQKQRRSRQGKSLKEKSKFVFKHRHLIVKRRREPERAEKKHLRTMLEYCRPRVGGSPDKLIGCSSPSRATTRPGVGGVLKQARSSRRSRIWGSLGESGGAEVRQDDRVLAGPVGVGNWCGRTITWSVATANCVTGKRSATNGVAAEPVRFVVLALDRWWQAAFTRPQTLEGSSAEPTKEGKSKARSTNKAA